MKISTLSVTKAMFGLFFAGLSPALSAQSVTFLLASSNPGSGAIAESTRHNKMLVFTVANTTGSPVNINDFQFAAIGPLASIGLRIDGTPAPLVETYSGNGIPYYDFDIGVIATGTHTYEVDATVGDYGAGESAYVYFAGMSGEWSPSIDIEDNSVLTGNIQAVVETLAKQTSLVNISSRAMVSAENPLVAGFVVDGDTGSKEFLIRGVGPALKAFGISNALADPVIVIYDGSGKVVASNQGWMTSAGSTQTIEADAATGAFPIGANDSALVVTLVPGSYSVEVTSASGGSGTALAEVYQVGN